MLRNIKYCLIAGIGILFFQACQNGKQRETRQEYVLKPDSSIKFAKRFALKRFNATTILYLFGNRNNHDTTAIFIIGSDSLTNHLFSKRAIWIKSPCKKIASLSSIYSAMLCELGCLDRIAAIDNIDYVNNPSIIDKHKNGGLKELARSPTIDLEKTVSLQPDIVFTFGMGEGEKDLDPKLKQTGIPVAISVDHLEESPLARAEWIKFFAAFVDKSHVADSLFAKVEKKYGELQSLAKNVRSKPSVFNEIKYSDAWYVPGGKSYVAQLLNDAGSNYLWKDDNKAGSLPLSFEQVYAKAKDADYWINLSTVKTKKELLGYESRYSEFKAFKTGHLYNNTKVTNAYGYSNYWETGMIHPERVLEDMIHIFHPELENQVNRVFYYYEQIK